MSSAVESAFVENHLQQCPSCQVAFDKIDLGDDVFVAHLHNVWPGIQGAVADNPLLSLRSYSEFSHAEDLPKRIGEYDILGILGRGGMGTVYKATHTRLGRTVALKVVSESKRLAPGFLERFRLEAEAVAKLQHPNIVQIFESGDHNGQPFCAFEYIPGGSLAEYMQAKSMPPRDVAALFLRIAVGLQHAHDNGIIHRDIKPANILLVEPGDPKIADFGLAKETSDQSKNTATGTIIGTAYYMAPEQANGRQQDVSALADIYSLGAVMYEALVGLPPFRGDSPLDTLELARSHEPINPSRFRPDIDRDVETVCLRCLEKTPQRRYASAQQFANDLQRYLNGEPIHARPVTNLERVYKWSKRHPASAGLIAVSLLAMTTLVTGTLLFSNQLSGKNRSLERQLDSARRGMYALQLRAVGLTHPTDPQQGVSLLDDNERCPAEFRDFTWHYLQHLCDRDAFELPDHDLIPRSLALSPNGRYLIAGGEGGRLLRWDTQDLANPHTLEGHSEHVNYVAFDATSAHLATASSDRTVRIWDVESGALVRVLEGHEDDVNAVTFLPSTPFLASAGTDRTVRVWNVDSGAQVYKLEGDRRNAHSSSIFCLASSPDGRKVISGGKDGTIRIWEWASDEPAAVYTGHRGAVRGLEVSPDGKLLASCGGGGLGEVRIWGLAEGGSLQALGESMRHRESVKSVAFSPDGNWIVSAADSGDLRFWDLTTRKPFLVLRAHKRQITSVIVADDGARVISAGDGAVKFWDVASPGPAELIGHENAVSSMTFLDNNQLLSASWDGSVRLWDTCNGQSDVVWQGPGNQRVLVASDGIHIAWASKGIAYIRPSSEPAQSAIRSVATGATLLNDLAFTSNRKGLIAAGDGNDIQVVDPSTFVVQSHATSKEERGHEILAVKPFSVNNRVVSITGEGIEFLNLDTGAGQSLRSMRLRSLAVSPDGTSIATGHEDGQITLWELPAGTVRTELRQHTASVRALAYSPDGRTLASASEDETVRLWDPIVGHERAILWGHQAPVDTISFSPNGRQLASGDSGGVIFIWRTQ